VPLALIVVTTVLAHAAFNGGRLGISLNALALGASPLTVGVMMSLFAALPMMLGVSAGRLVDRVGIRRPILAAAALLALSVSLPAIHPGIVSLFLAAAGAGTGFMLFQICAQHAVGAMGAEADRKANFGWLALGFSISGFFGPTFAGFAIDALGFRATFGLLAALALTSLLRLATRRERLPHAPQAPAAAGRRSAWELARHPELRRIFLVTALLSSAWDVFMFVMPIYGTSIGLSASTIGLVIGSFALATFIVRIALPWLSRHLNEWPMITATMGIACVAYALFPMVKTVPLLASIAFLLGLGLGATQPSVMSLIYAAAPEGRAGEAVGVRTVVLNASFTILPLAFGGVGAALGMAPIFWSMSAALAGGGWLANRRRLALRRG
jgi:predicted MFS family arabinose efflux permease